MHISCHWNRKRSFLLHVGELFNCTLGLSIAYRRMYVNCLIRMRYYIINIKIVDYYITMLTHYFCNIEFCKKRTIVKVFDASAINRTWERFSLINLVWWMSNKNKLLWLYVWIINCFFWYAVSWIVNKNYWEY